MPLIINQDLMGEYRVEIDNSAEINLKTKLLVLIKKTLYKISDELRKTFRAKSYFF